MNKVDWREVILTIKVRGKEIHLGMFDNQDDARAVYLAAKKIHHPLSAQQLKETK